MCGECFQLATHCLFMEYFLTPTYTIIIPFLVKTPSAASEGACCTEATPRLSSTEEIMMKMENEPLKTKRHPAITAFKLEIKQRCII